MVLHLNKLETPSPKYSLCQIWLKLAKRFWREDLLIPAMYFRYFVIIFPWLTAGPFVWTNLIPLHPSMSLWSNLVEIGKVVLDKRFFNFGNVFSLFRYYLPLVNGGPFIWTNLNPHHPRMLCAKFGWNWPSGSGEEDENVKSLRQRRQRQRRTTDLRLRWDNKRYLIMTLTSHVKKKKEKRKEKDQNLIT